jgi:hypothetical protein
MPFLKKRPEKCFLQIGYSKISCKAKKSHAVSNMAFEVLI